MNGSTLKKDADASMLSSLCIKSLKMMCLIEAIKKDSNMDSLKVNLLGSLKDLLKANTLESKKVLKKEFMMGSILGLMKDSKLELESCFEMREKKILT